MANEPREEPKSNPLTDRLGLLGDLSKLGDRATDATHFYDLLLEACEKLFDNELDQNVFEDQLRYMFGIHVRIYPNYQDTLLTFPQHGYKMFTIDKVIGAIVKQVGIISH